jgi:hypothetical protein
MFGEYGDGPATTEGPKKISVFCLISSESKCIRLSMTRGIKSSTRVTSPTSWRFAFTTSSSLCQRQRPLVADSQRPHDYAAGRPTFQLGRRAPSAGRRRPQGLYRGIKSCRQSRFRAAHGVCALVGTTFCERSHRSNFLGVRGIGSPPLRASVRKAQENQGAPNDRRGCVYRDCVPSTSGTQKVKCRGDKRNG